MARQATNTSMVSIGETPLGHMDGSVAINRNAVVVDSTDDATIMSHNFQHGFKGVRIAAMFSRNVLTQAQKEEVQVNLCKLVA